MQANQPCFVPEFSKHILSDIIKLCLKNQNERINAKNLVLSLKKIIEQIDMNNLSINNDSPIFRQKLPDKNINLDDNEEKETFVKKNFIDAKFDVLNQNFLFNESMELHSGDPIHNYEDLKFIKNLKLIQTDFCQNSNSKYWQKNSLGTLKTHLRSLSMFYNLKKLTVDLSQNLYDRSTLISALESMSKLPVLESLNLKLANSIFKIVPYYLYCAMLYWPIIICCCGCPLCIQKNMSCGCEKCYRYYVEHKYINEANYGSGVELGSGYSIENDLFQLCCLYLSKMTELNELVLDLRNNSIYEFQLNLGINYFLENKASLKLKNLTIDLRNQYKLSLPILNTEDIKFDRKSL